MLVSQSKGKELRNHIVSSCKTGILSRPVELVVSLISLDAYIDPKIDLLGLVYLSETAHP